MKKLIAILLCLLVGFPAAADIAYEPPFSSFYEKVQDDTQRVERDYYTNGQKGYIALRKAPDGSITRYVTNAKKVHVFCFYKDWAMITHLDGQELSTPCWVEQSALYLIYDEQSFREEYAHEIENGSATLILPEGCEFIYIYAYPGAAEPFDYSYLSEEDPIVCAGRYTDPEGRLWGRISYYRGIRRKWVCLDEPNQIIPPFGGDPNLALIEAAAIPEADQPMQEETPDLESELPPDMPDPEVEQTPAISPIIPAEKPPAFVLNPLPWLAVGLVALAIGAAVVLLILCYKRKEK